VVPIADTVVNIWAVMVKSFYAAVTNIAMPASWGSNNFALGAHVKGVAFIKKQLKVHIFVSSNVSWVSKSGNTERNYEGCCKSKKESKWPKRFKSLDSNVLVACNWKNKDTCKKHDKDKLYKEK
jgi:hypothetical protein